VTLSRPLLVALLLAALAAAPGCFVDEIDKSMEIYESAGPGAARKVKEQEAAAQRARAEAAKPGKPGKPGKQDEKPSIAQYWQKARTLGSEPKNESIVGCSLDGRVEYMMRDDCLARGGEPR
jgi:hypothetical protein